MPDLFDYPIKLFKNQERVVVEEVKSELYSLHDKNTVTQFQRSCLDGVCNIQIHTKLVSNGKPSKGNHGRERVFINDKARLYFHKIFARSLGLHNLGVLSWFVLG